VPPNEDAWDALLQMMEAGGGPLLVVRNGRLQGVVGQDSLARLVQRKLQLGPG
jgi:lysophospholipase L1-like esterase